MLLRRDHRDRAGIGCRGGVVRRRGVLAKRDGRTLVAARKARRHDGLFHLGRSAHRARDQLALGLLVIGGGILKPAFEAMALVAGQRVLNHASPPTRCRWVGSAIGSITSKRRPCCSEGTRERAADTSAGSTSAKITPGSVPP